MVDMVTIRFPKKNHFIAQKNRPFGGRFFYELAYFAAAKRSAITDQFTTFQNAAK